VSEALDQARNVLEGRLAPTFGACSPTDLLIIDNFEERVREDERAAVVDALAEIAHVVVTHPDLGLRLAIDNIVERALSSLRETK